MFFFYIYRHTFWNSINMLYKMEICRLPFFQYYSFEHYFASYWEWLIKNLSDIITFYT